ncbi:hypothetical protein H849_21515 [Prescottella equi NBRC 101255 = C 7]|nr:hypothetical protein H849_21515 [Prescottella equi NBRC 101255 = C 7]
MAPSMAVDPPTTLVPAPRGNDRNTVIDGEPEDLLDVGRVGGTYHHGGCSGLGIEAPVLPIGLE